MASTVYNKLSGYVIAGLFLAMIITYPANAIPEPLLPSNSSTSSFEYPNTSMPVYLFWDNFDQLFYQVTNLQVASGSNFTTSLILNTTTPYANYSLNLPVGHYYWKVRYYNIIYSNYTNWSNSTFNFYITRTGFPQLNITALDEQNNTSISNFSVQLTNATVVLTKNTSSGTVTFNDSDGVTFGEYSALVSTDIPLNGSSVPYAPRYLLTTVSSNVTVYLPSTTPTINTIAFYLQDYTDTFPYKSSKITIYKGNRIMSTGYFDADAKFTSYLISGDTYHITITSGTSIFDWGNYIPVSTGNVDILITAVPLPTGSYFNYNITVIPKAQITFSFNTQLPSWVLFGIYENDILVHSFAVYPGDMLSGQSNYIITNTSGYYKIMLVATNAKTNINTTRILDYRSANTTLIGHKWEYGTFTMPQWVMNTASFLIIVILMGSFGALYAGLGGLIGIIVALFFMSNEWLQVNDAAYGFFTGLAVLIIYNYIREKGSG